MLSYNKNCELQAVHTTTLILMVTPCLRSAIAEILLISHTYTSQSLPYLNYFLNYYMGFQLQQTNIPKAQKKVNVATVEL